MSSTDNFHPSEKAPRVERVRVALDATVARFVRFGRSFRCFAFDAGALAREECWIAPGYDDAELHKPTVGQARLQYVVDPTVLRVVVFDRPTSELFVFTSAAHAGSSLNIIGIEGVAWPTGGGSGGAGGAVILDSVTGAAAGTIRYGATNFPGVVLAGADPALIVPTNVTYTGGVAVGTRGNLPTNPYTAAGSTLDTTAWDQASAALAAGATLVMAAAGDRHGIIASSDNGGGIGPVFRRTNVNAQAGIRCPESGGVATTWPGSNFVPCGGTDIYARHAGGGPVLYYSILKAIT